MTTIEITYKGVTVKETFTQEPAIAQESMNFRRVWMQNAMKAIDGQLGVNITGSVEIKASE